MLRLFRKAASACDPVEVQCRGETEASTVLRMRRDASLDWRAERLRVHEAERVVELLGTAYDWRQNARHMVGLIKAPCGFVYLECGERDFMEVIVGFQA